MLVPCCKSEFPSALQALRTKPRHLVRLMELSLNISRDMHCWQMSINVTPVGYSHFFNFTISPKAGLLQDLKINKTKYFYNQ